MKRDVQLFLKFEDYKNTNMLRSIQSLIPLSPYWFWKEGEQIERANGTLSESKYGYSMCAYMKNGNYDSLEDDIYSMLNIFMPFDKQLIRLKKEYDFEVTFTLCFNAKKKILPFVMEFRYLDFLSRISADFEFT
jgi:hypothetical protein